MKPTSIHFDTYHLVYCIMFIQTLNTINPKPKPKSQSSNLTWIEHNTVSKRTSMSWMQAKVSAWLLVPCDLCMFMSTFHLLFSLCYLGKFLGLTVWPTDSAGSIWGAFIMFHMTFPWQPTLSPIWHWARSFKLSTVLRGFSPLYTKISASLDYALKSAIMSRSVIDFPHNFSSDKKNL